MTGPISAADLTLKVTTLRKAISARLLSMPALDGPVKIDLLGSPVSRRHAQLSFELAFESGSDNLLSWGSSLTLEP